MLASEILRSDIVSVQRAVSNSERANQVIATSESALGQVSSLLNDIRGLHVTRMDLTQLPLEQTTDAGPNYGIGNQAHLGPVDGSCGYVAHGLLQDNCGALYEWP